MCRHCEGKYGKDFKIKQSADNIYSMTEGFISNTKDDEVPGIVLFRYGHAFGVFNIAYCPFCGRKITKNVQEVRVMKLLIDSARNKISLNDVDITDSVKEISIKAEDKKTTIVVLSIPTENVNIE